MLDRFPRAVMYTRPRPISCPRGEHLARHYPGGLSAAAAAMLVFLALFAGILPSPCSASSNIVIVINSEDLAVFVSHDGSADMQYIIHLTVRPQSSIVTGLTIHLPNWRFETSKTTVTINSKVVQDLKKIGKAENDLALSLGPALALQPDTTYALSVLVSMGAMAMKSPAGAGKARVSVTPTWWDPNTVQEVQAMSVSLNLPEDFLDQSKVQSTTGATTMEHGGRIVLTWNFTGLSPGDRKEVHADFPASAVSKVYDPFWDVQFHFYEAYLYIFLVVAIVAVAAYGVKRYIRRPYIKPYLNVEGWGIYEGLGPMEAALLLDLGDDCVVAMFLLDLAMVDAIEVTDPQKMLVEIRNPDYEGRSSQLLGCIRGGRLDPISTTNLLGSLRDEILGKLDGHDMEGTKAHYASIGPSKWTKVKKGKAPPVDDILWLMTAPKANERFEKARFEGVPDWGSWKVVL